LAKRPDLTAVAAPDPDGAPSKIKPQR
jgi:hypothetical protein